MTEAHPYVGGKVQKVWQPDENTIVLALYAEGKEALFMLSCHPVFARAHFVTRRPSSMQPLPSLCTALRARVDGGRVAAIRQVDFDRILVMDFEALEGPHTLIAELMGKHSNLIFLDPNQRVIAAAKWVGRSKSVRPIQAGRVYEPPPFEPKPSLLDAKPGDAFEGFHGASPFLLKLIEAGEALEGVQRAAKEGHFSPVLVPGSGAYPIPVDALGLQGLPRASISVALEQHFDAAIVQERVRALKESLLGQLRRVLLAREVALHELRQTADAAKRAGELQLMGELILAYGPTLAEGSKSLVAQDYEGNELTIKLDPEKGYLENAQGFFDKAKRSKSRAGAVHEQIDRLSEDHALIQSLIARAEEEERFDRLEGLRDEARKRRWLHDTTVVSRRKDERPFEGNRVRELLGPGGYTIYYGENSEANDYLLTRLAKPNDYWLHIRGSQSAHVLIVTNNHPEKVSKEVILYAARIAVQNSPSKHSGYVPVDYTLRKYVRKPRGAPKGSALYTHEKTVHVE